MYLCVCVFWAVLGLCCGLFSSCPARGLLSSWGAWAFHCGGFSCALAWTAGSRAGGLQSLQSVGLVVVACRLSAQAQ